MGRPGEFSACYCYLKARVQAFGWLEVCKSILTMDNLQTRKKIIVHACPCTWWMQNRWIISFSTVRWLNLFGGLLWGCLDDVGFSQNTSFLFEACQMRVALERDKSYVKSFFSCHHLGNRKRKEFAMFWRKIFMGRVLIGKGENFMWWSGSSFLLHFEIYLCRLSCKDGMRWPSLILTRLFHLRWLRRWWAFPSWWEWSWQTVGMWEELFEVWEGWMFLSFAEPVGKCSMNKPELLALRIGLLLAHQGIWSGSWWKALCVIRWAMGSCRALWQYPDKVEEVMDLADLLEASFHHVQRIANSRTNLLAEEEVCQQSWF